MARLIIEGITEDQAKMLAAWMQYKGADESRYWLIDRGIPPIRATNSSEREVDIAFAPAGKDGEDTTVTLYMTPDLTHR